MGIKTLGTKPLRNPVYLIYQIDDVIRLFRRINHT